MLNRAGIHSEALFIGGLSSISILCSENRYFECKRWELDWTGLEYVNHEFIDKWTQTAEGDSVEEHAFAIMRGLARWILAGKPVNSKPAKSKSTTVQKSLKERLES